MGNSKPIETLETFIWNGDLASVERFLDENPKLDLNATEHASRTALTLAAMQNELAIVKCLLKRGASPEIRTTIRDETPIVLALRQCASLEVIKALVEAISSSEQKAQYINHPDEDGWTALHWLGTRRIKRQKEDYAIAKYLIAAGGDVDLVIQTGTAAGFTAAHLLAAVGTPEVLRALLEERPEAIDGGPSVLNKGETILHVAARYGFVNGGVDNNLSWVLDHVDPFMARKRSDNNMTAWETIWDGSDRYRLEAIAAFVLKDRRNKTMNKLFDWKAVEPRSPRLPQYNLRCNTAPGTFALVRDLLSQKKISKEAYLKFFHDFGILHGQESVYRIRQARCLFENHERTYQRRAIIRIGTENEDCEKDGTQSAAAGEMDNGYEVDTWDTATINRDGIVPDYLSIVMPFFHRQHLGQTRMWRDAQKRKEVFTRSWEYCLSDSPETYGVYMSLTLDEYCNPVLDKRILQQRNTDQVLTRIMRAKRKRETKDANEDDLELIAVNNACIWNIEDTFIVSPCYEYGSESSDFGGFEVGDTALGSVWSPGSRLKHIGMIMTRFIDSLDNPALWGSDRKWKGRQPLLDAFDKAITLLVEDVNKYTDSVGITKISIEAERKYLHEINDIFEELSMIKNVLLVQENVWKSFASNAWPHYWPNGEEGRMVIPREDWASFSADDTREWKRIIEAQSLFERYRRRMSHLNENAERVERVMLIKLDLKQKHTSLQESHSTAIMSAAVLGFTIVTIIFTPLSFVTALFALPIDEFQDNMAGTTDSKTYSSSYIAKWAVTTFIVSTIFAAAAIWVAIERGMDVPLTKGTIRLLTGASARERTAIAKQDAIEEEYQMPSVSGWWRDKTVNAQSAENAKEESGSEVSEKQDGTVQQEDLSRLSDLLGRLRRRKRSGQVAV